MRYLICLTAVLLATACGTKEENAADAGTTADAGTPANVAKIVAGLDFYALNGCASCHCNAAQGGCNLDAPSIQGISADNLTANLIYASTAEEDPTISEPFDPHPLKLTKTTADEISALEAFLDSLAPGAKIEDDSLIGRGYALYVSGDCISCHLMSAQGTAQGGIGQAIANAHPDVIYGALSGAVVCHPLQRTEPMDANCSILGEYITDNPTVTALTDTVPPNTDEERYLLAHFLAFIAPPPTGGVVDPCQNRMDEICTVAGNGIGGYSKDGVPATESLLYFPQDITLHDVNGDTLLDLGIADWNNHRIRLVHLDAEIDGVKDPIETIAGNSKVTGSDTLNHPTDLAFDPLNGLYISGWHNQNIYRYPQGLVRGSDRDQLAGLCALICPPDSDMPQPAESTFLGGPVSVSLHPDGRIFVAESTCVRIRTLTVTSSSTLMRPSACPSNVHLYTQTTIETLAGIGSSVGADGDDGPARMAKFNSTRGTSLPNFRIALEHGPDPERLYVTDSQNNTIRYVNLKATPPTVHLLAGRSGMDGVGFVDGMKGDARFNYPTNVYVDEAGYVYVSDARNHAVRKISREGLVETIAGTGRAGFNGDNIPAKEAQLNNPNGVVVHPDGRVFISDTNNNRIRVIRP